MGVGVRVRVGVRVGVRARVGAHLGRWHREHREHHPVGPRELRVEPGDG